MTEDTPKITVGSSTFLGTAAIGPSRVAYSPTTWRLARRNGELILQAGSIWTKGALEGGIEWNDVPTVDLDELNTPTTPPEAGSPGADESPNLYPANCGM
jgi:hypothetical protein